MPRRSPIDDRWSEVACLRGGERVQLRLLRADDKERLQAFFASLSPESRYLRFFYAKSELTAAELRELTELDGVSRVALAALDEGGDRLLAVARFARAARAPSAEAAIVVADAAQRKGLGRLLLARLMAAARERGIERFRYEVLAENVAMRKLVQRAVPAMREKRLRETVALEVPLPGTPLAAEAAVEEIVLGALVLSALPGVIAERTLTRASEILGRLFDRGGTGKGRVAAPGPAPAPPRSPR